MKFLLGVIALASAAVKEELTGDEFNDLKSKSPLFVKFYAPWCGHCKNLAPTWSELAEEINPDAEWEAQIVSVDCTQHKQVCADNGVQGYPTLKLFFPGTADGTKYQGARSKQALSDWLDGELAKQFDAPAEKEEAPAAAAPKKGEVAVLTAASFKSTVEPAEQVTFVKFFAPWCGHCKKMAQTWVDLAKDQAAVDNVVIAEVDCTVEQSVCQENGVKGYPTLKAFKGGKEIEKYAGGRDMASFKAALTKYTGAKAAPKAEEPKAAATGGAGSTDLTADDFASSIGNGNWFVKFYAPWCGHCKAMAQTWEDLANAQKDATPKVNIASVDCTQHNDICKENGVKGFPTLLFFQNGKNLGKHQGGRDQKSLESSIKSFVNPKAAQEEEKKAGAGAGEFDAAMAGKHTFVKFFAPWCGHCKAMAPAWKELQGEFDGSASTQILDVDCTSDEGKPLCQAAGVRGYPTLQYFGPKVVLGSGEKYAGGRDLAALKKFIEGKAGHDEL